MEYNTERDKLIMPEHGRNIQKMITHAMNTEDRDERNKLALAIIDVMGQLNPHLRDYADFKHKLWDHLFLISNFKLDVDSPYPIPSSDTLQVKPEPIHYPSNHIKYKHYGKNLELIIDEIKKLESEEERQQFVSNLANFMKVQYLSWNRDSVDDDQISNDLNTLSGGALQLDENAKLHNTNDILRS